MIADSMSKQAGSSGLFWFWTFAGVFNLRAYGILVIR